MVAYKNKNQKVENSISDLKIEKVKNTNEVTFH